MGLPQAKSVDKKIDFQNFFYLFCQRLYHAVVGIARQSWNCTLISVKDYVDVPGGMTIAYYKNRKIIVTSHNLQSHNYARVKDKYHFTTDCCIHFPAINAYFIMWSQFLSMCMQNICKLGTKVQIRLFYEIYPNNSIPNNKRLTCISYVVFYMKNIPLLM